MVAFVKIYTVCIETGDFIGFSKFTGLKNEGLQWLNRCQNFDFQIALTFFLIKFFGRLHETIRTCMPDSL